MAQTEISTASPASGTIVRELLAKGVSLIDILDQLGIEPEAPAPKVTLPKVAPLTETQLDALKALPEVLEAVTIPQAKRKLTAAELEALATARKTIDDILTPTEKWKSNTIKHVASNHLDVVAEETGLVDENTQVDEHGHYLIKNDAPILALGVKFDRTISDPPPQISSAKLEAAHEAGVFDRKQYLGLTVEQPVKRIFDETKARKLIREDPSLLGKIAVHATTPGKKIASLYLRKL
jgi:hypothetical protein